MGDDGKVSPPPSGVKRAGSRAAFVLLRGGGQLKVSVQMEARSLSESANEQMHFSYTEKGYSRSLNHPVE